jgi:hypothetical protein
VKRITATLALVAALTLTACGGGGSSRQGCVDAWNRKVAAHNALVHKWDTLPDGAVAPGTDFDAWVKTQGGDPTAGDVPACVRDAFNK